MRESAKIAFHVYEVLTGVEDTMVHGRCCEGPICSGDTFDVVYDVIPQEKEGKYLAPIRNALGSVRIKVTALFTYGHQVNRLDPGLSGSIVISGQGIKLIQEDCFLGVAELKSNDNS